MEATVSMRVVRGLVIAAEKAGASRAELLRAAGIEPEQLEAEAQLPRSEVFRITKIAMDLAGDPALGLHWAEGLTPTTFNPISLLIAHSGSLRQGFESLAKFERLLSDEARYELLEHADKVTLRCLLMPGEVLRVQRFAAEMMVGSFFRIVRSFNVRPEQVSFEYPAPDYHDEYTRIFGPAVAFEQPFTGMVFDRALLDAASPNQDEDVHQALQSVAERRMLRLSQHAPYAQRVREFLVQQHSPRRVDMETVATALGLSVRSLRRRLAAEGKSYSAAENEALAIVAKRLLCDERRTIQETAYEMGFADRTAFQRAFKRWTGTTPSAYRENR